MVRSKRGGEPVEILTSRVTGVKCLAAAAATIFPTRPDPVYRTAGGVSGFNDTGTATDYDPTAAPVTWSRRGYHRSLLGIDLGLDTEGRAQREGSL